MKIYRLTYVVVRVVVVVAATTVLKAIPRESYRGRLLWDIDCGGLYEVYQR